MDDDDDDVDTSISMTRRPRRSRPQKKPARVRDELDRLPEAVQDIDGNTIIFVDSSDSLLL